MTCIDKVNKILVSIGVDINNPWIIQLVEGLCASQGMIEEDIVDFVCRQVKCISLLNVLRKIYKLDAIDIEDLKKIIFTYKTIDEIHNKLRHFTAQDGRNPTINGTTQENQSKKDREIKKCEENSNAEKKLKKAEQFKDAAKTLEIEIPLANIAELEFGYAYGLITFKEALGILQEYKMGLNKTDNELTPLTKLSIF